MEVLKFEYDANGPSIRGVVPAMNDQGVRLMGPPDPETTKTLTDFAAYGDEEASLVADLMAWLVRAEPLIRRIAMNPAKDPDAVQAQANANAREAERIRLADEASVKLKADAEDAAALAEDQRKASEAAHAELTQRLEAARAELAEVEALKSEAKESE